MAADPYKYFRVEAREIIEELGKGVLELEKGASAEVTSRLLRLAHTLKGAARVVKQGAIAEHAHAFEAALGPLRQAGAALEAAQAEEVLKIVDAMSSSLSTLAPAPGQRVDAPSPVAAAEGPLPPALQAVRPDVRELDTVLDGIAEAGVELQSMRQAIGGLERAHQLAELLVETIGVRGQLGTTQRARAIAKDLRGITSELVPRLKRGVGLVEREVQQAGHAAERLRLLPVSAIFGALERTARDAAQELGRRVAFTATAADVRLDADVLGALQTALVQLVRNAIAHGIDLPEERAARGKPETGRVELEVSRRGGRVAFLCRDDGRGVDVEAVRRAALAKGINPGSAPADVVRLLLRGGLSTSTEVTQVSGRGIGLDVVRDVATRLGGEVDIETAPGRGTSVEIVVPISLSSVEALLLEAGGVSAAIPLAAIGRTLRVEPRDIARTVDGESVTYEGSVIPFAPLGRMLGQRRDSRAARACSAVVVRGATALAVIGVDRLVGTANLVVRRLPALAPAGPVVAGASLDAEGNPQLVLDPEEIVRAAGRPERAATSEPRPPMPILVIDDSLTTRMLEQSILESAGFEVDVATSAEQGLEKALRRRYGLFLVDVEMPGMDGFTFVETTRADPRLRDVPSILVTSRNAPEDRRRGEEVGARDYIVKSEFDQARFLGTVRRLVE